MSGFWVTDAGVPVALAWHTDTVGVVVSIRAVLTGGALVARVTLVTHWPAAFVCQNMRKIKQAIFNFQLLLVVMFCGY